MVEDKAIEFVADIGLEVLKEKLIDASMKKRAHKLLVEYLKKQEKFNFSCAIDEEIDFECLSNYICKNLIKDVKLHLFGNSKERKFAYETIISKAIDFAQANTHMSKQRVIKIVGTSINLLRDYYKRKSNQELAFYEGCIEDTVIEEIDNKHDETMQTLNSIQNQSSISSTLSLDYNIQLSKNGQIEEACDNVLSCIKALGTTHPLYPYFCYGIDDTSGNFVSKPLSKEAKLKYPLSYKLSGSSVHVGSMDITDLQNCDILKYSYNHQLPISMHADKVEKLLGQFHDPLQAEATEMQGCEVTVFPPKFPKAFPCSLIMNNKTIFDYLLMRTKEINEDGTELITNEQQKNRSVNVSFMIDTRKNSIGFKIHPLYISFSEHLKYLYFIKEATHTGSLDIKILDTNTYLFIGKYKALAQDINIDDKIDFTKKIVEIEKHFKVRLNIPETVTFGDNLIISRIYDIIYKGCFSDQWSELNFGFEVCQDFKNRIANMKDTYYEFIYSATENVELYGNKFSYPTKIKLIFAKFKDLKRLQEKVKVLDIGDKVTITLVSDEKERKNIFITPLDNNEHQLIE